MAGLTFYKASGQNLTDYKVRPAHCSQTIVEYIQIYNTVVLIYLILCCQVATSLKAT